MRAFRTIIGVGTAPGSRSRRAGVRVLPVLLVPALLLGAAAGAGAAPLPLTGRHVPAASVHHSSVAPLTLANVQVYLANSNAPLVTNTNQGLQATYDAATGTLEVRWGNPANSLLQGDLIVGAGVALKTGTTVSSGITLQDDGFTCTTDSGSASVLIDQLQYEPDGTVTSLGVAFACELTDGSQLTNGTAAINIVPTTPGQGYYLYEQTGAIGGFGNDSFLNYLGDLSATPLNQPVVGMAQTPDGAGYWLTAADGGVFAYGDAGFYGSTGNLTLNKPIVGMAATHDGKGYWFVASDGGIFAYGDAPFYGSTGSLTLNQPIVGMAPTPDGRGYWMVAADGGIFAYGDAAFYGSTGSLQLNKPIVGMAATPDGRGYWLVASDGGIFSFGDGYFYGSTGSLNLTEPVEGMASTPDGKGYWMVASDGGIFAFGDAPFEGSLGGQGITDIAGISPG